ncbi:hypothetical protein, partial [Pseudonocardia tropica]|uniref:hypothetical protein n=1 Tax=Pseudonocardia tropica TaxID=681289 RepID=UPI0031EFC823
QLSDPVATALRSARTLNPEEPVIAVRNVNRWDFAGASQRYSIGVSLERDEQHSALYGELAASLPVLNEVELRAEPLLLDIDG